MGAYGTGIVTGTEIANGLCVPRSRVDMWRARGTQGFPAPIASVHIPRNGGRRKAPLWLEQDVIFWWLAYDPNRLRGGKPGNAGNKNAKPPSRKGVQGHKLSHVVVDEVARVDWLTNMEKVRKR